jgi:hypothetical protein
MKTIIVCGGRDFNDRDLLINTLADICDGRGWNQDPNKDGLCLPDVRIISGGAPGADRLAVSWAIANWCAFKEYPADWSRGKSAGPIRNQAMLNEKPDLVVAFPGGRGTADMVRRAKAQGFDVVEIPASPPA